MALLYVQCYHRSLMQVLMIASGFVTYSKILVTIIASMIAPCIGLVFLAEIIVIAIISYKENPDPSLNEQLKILKNKTRSYMYRHHVPKDLQKQVLNFIERRYATESVEDEDILALLSEPLRNQLQVLRHEFFFMSIPEIQTLNIQAASILVKYLKRESYNPGQTIGNISMLRTRLIFIESGQISEVSYEGEIVKDYKDGEYLGQCFTDDDRVKQNSEIKSIVATDAIILTYEDVQAAANESNDINMILKHYKEQQQIEDIL